MEIIKSKRISKCLRCANPITSKYKVWEWKNKYSHLSCYFGYLKRKLERTKQEIKQFSKQKFKKVMILENL